MPERRFTQDSRHAGVSGAAIKTSKKLKFLGPVAIILLATLVFAGSLQWQSNRLGDSLRATFQKNQQVSIGVLAAATEQEFRQHVDRLISLAFSDELREGPPRSQKALDEMHQRLSPAVDYLAVVDAKVNVLHASPSSSAYVPSPCDAAGASVELPSGVSYRVSRAPGDKRLRVFFPLPGGRGDGLALLAVLNIDGILAQCAVETADRKSYRWLIDIGGKHVCGTNPSMPSSYSVLSVDGATEQAAEANSRHNAARYLADTCVRLGRSGTALIAKAEAGSDVNLVVRPEDVDLLPPERAAEDQSLYRGTVTKLTFLGNYTDYRVDVLGRELRVQGASVLPYGEGDAVAVQLDAVPCFVIYE